MAGYRAAVYAAEVFVTETFVSLQGEGMLVGMPSYFIRTGGCNLRCRWCDTPYASVLPEGGRQGPEELVKQALASGVRHVVVTGGEPLLQRQIGRLSRQLRRAGFHVTVETAATVDADFECDLLSASPKTSSSDPLYGRWRQRHQRLRSELGPLQRLLQRFPEHQLKLVIQEADDLTEVLGLLKRVGPVDRCRVLLMPEGQSAAEVAQRAPLVAALCLEHGFRYTPRLHLPLFGGGRGV